jgi:hypothetical protein
MGMGKANERKEAQEMATILGIVLPKATVEPGKENRS